MFNAHRRRCCTVADIVFYYSFGCGSPMMCSGPAHSIPNFDFMTVLRIVFDSRVKRDRGQRISIQQTRMKLISYSLLLMLFSIVFLEFPHNLILFASCSIAANYCFRIKYCLIHEVVNFSIIVTLPLLSSSIEYTSTIIVIIISCFDRYS